VRWQGSRESDNVEDDRGSSGGGFGGGPGLKLGVGGLVAVVAAYFFGIDPRIVLSLLQATQPAAVEQRSASAAVADSGPEGQRYHFARTVLAMTEDTWTQVFGEGGARYTTPTLVLYRDEHPTACGVGEAAAGPFYCPGDQKVYIDLAFYDQLAREFKAPGEFAQAYVIAHEVGHHVQFLLGTEAKVRAAQERARTEEARNRLQVAMELQADCYAGVWANRTERRQKFLDPGDIEEALRAAAAVGDDTIQRRTRGYVVPDSFTHGSAAQRTEWFGDPAEDQGRTP
jgi:uncharacterized protein